MPFIVNDTTIKHLIANDTVCKQHIVNGVVVYNSEEIIVADSAFQNDYAFTSNVSYAGNDYGVGQCYVGGTTCWVKGHPNGIWQTATGYLTIPTRDYSTLTVTARFMTTDGGGGGLYPGATVALRSAANTNVSNSLASSLSEGSLFWFGETWKASMDETRTVSWDIESLTSDCVLQAAASWYGTYDGSTYDGIHKIKALVQLKSVMLT